MKQCKEEFTDPLTDIINKSLTQESFTTELKIAKVYLKFKNRSDESGSYRLISFIPTSSTVMEKIVLKRLSCHLELHNLLTSQQYQLCQLTKALIQHRTHHKSVWRWSYSNNLLDFSRDFDCLNHDQLLNKFIIIGIRGKEGEWLKDRNQAGRNKLHW